MGWGADSRDPHRDGERELIEEIDKENDIKRQSQGGGRGTG